MIYLGPSGRYYSVHSLHSGIRSSASGMGHKDKEQNRPPTTEAALIFSSMHGGHRVWCLPWGDPSKLGLLQAVAGGTGHGRAEHG